MSHNAKSIAIAQHDQLRGTLSVIASLHIYECFLDQI